MLHMKIFHPKSMVGIEFGSESNNFFCTEHNIAPRKTKSKETDYFNFLSSENLSGCCVFKSSSLFCVSFLHLFSKINIEIQPIQHISLT